MSAAGEVRQTLLAAALRAYAPTAKTYPYFCVRCLCDLSAEELGTSCGEDGCPGAVAA